MLYSGVCDVAKKKKKKFIEDAIKRPGAFTAKAEK